MKFKKRLETEGSINLFHSINLRAKEYNGEVDKCNKTAREYMNSGNTGAAKFFLNRAEKYIRKFKNLMKTHDKLVKANTLYERDLRKKMRLILNSNEELGLWGEYMKCFAGFM